MDRNKCEIIFIITIGAFLVSGNSWAWEGDSKKGTAHLRALAVDESRRGASGGSADKRKDDEELVKYITKDPIKGYDIHETLRLLRKASQLSQWELAKQAGVSVSTIRKMETDGYYATKDGIKKITVGGIRKKYLLDRVAAQEGAARLERAQGPEARARIKALREKRNLSIEDMAWIFGCSPKAIERSEKPSAKMLDRDTLRTYEAISRFWEHLDDIGKGEVRPLSFLRISRATALDRQAFALPATPNQQIVVRNRSYLLEGGWLTEDFQFPYERPYILEDPSLPHLLSKYITWLKSFESIQKLPEGQIRHHCRRAFGLLAAVWQGIYMASQGDIEAAERVYLDGMEKFVTFNPIFNWNSIQYALEQFGSYTQNGPEPQKADMFYREALRMYGIFGASSLGLEGYTRILLKQEYSQGKRGVSLVADISAAILLDYILFIKQVEENDFARIFSLGEDMYVVLKRHFENCKKAIMQASASVNKQGTCMIIGAGNLTITPLVELLRERLPDGELKYSKIILADITPDIITNKLNQMRQSGEISEEEFGRLEIKVTDASHIVEKTSHVIDGIIDTRLQKEKDPRGTIEEIIRFCDKIKTSEGLAAYLDDESLRQANNSFTFIVYAMTLTDMNHNLRDYVNVVIDLEELEEKEPELYEKLMTALSSLVPALADVVLRDVSRILQEEGVVSFIEGTAVHGFRGDFYIYENKSLSELVPERLPLMPVNYAAWLRPLPGGIIVPLAEIESLAMRKDTAESYSPAMVHSKRAAELVEEFKPEWDRLLLAGKYDREMEDEAAEAKYAASQI